jgi:hypothetical protein
MRHAEHLFVTLSLAPATGQSATQRHRSGRALYVAEKRVSDRMFIQFPKKITPAPAKTSKSTGSE